MAQIPVGETTLEVQDTRDSPEDSRPTVCFSHGLLFSHRMFLPQIEALRADFRCVAWDHRGQGRSPVPAPRPMSIEACTTDAIRLLEGLGSAPVHFVGLSMGGFVGMRIAARRPDLVRSLTLIATAPDREPAHNLPKYRRLNALGRLLGMPRFLADRVLRVMVGAATLASADAARRDHIRGLLMENTRHVHWAVRGVLEREGVEHELGQIRCPTLVLRGEQDVAIAHDRARKLVDGIAGAQWAAVPDAGHTATLEQPQTVTRELRAFLGAR